MMKISPLVLGLSLVAACNCAAIAQDQSAAIAPPKVLQVTREFTKPGKGGAIHDKTESAFVQAMARAKWPTHYIAMNSLSGKSRALYLTGYDSFEAWEKDNRAVGKNSTLSAEVERASVADGESLDSMDQMVYVYNAEQSYRASGDISKDRYMEIAVYHVRPGRSKEWEELVKMAIAANEKAGTSAHWATYELVYGGEGGTFVLLSADKSLAEIDLGFKEDKKFHEAIGEEGWKKFDALFGAAVDTGHSELFSFNPRQSYVGDMIDKDDPGYWKPKATAAAEKPAADKAKAKQ